MGLIDRLFKRTRQDKSTPLHTTSAGYGQFERPDDATGTPSRRAHHARKKARKQRTKSRRANR
jgi:hypothetical protein